MGRLRRRPRFASAWIGVLAVSLLGSALSKAEVIWEGNDQAVTLAPQDDASAPPNDHPARMTPREIETRLEALRFRFADQRDDAPPAAVFNREQLEILGEALAAGLARATPGQDVTFSVIGAHRLSPGAFARRNRLTAGRAFVREGKLNLILGEIQSPHRKKNIYGRIEQDFHPRRYGRRSESAAQESLLVAGPFASLHGDARHDWVVFDAERAATAVEASAAPADDAREPEPAPPAAAPSASGSAAAGSAGRHDTASPRAAADRDIEERLVTLKRLREQDLISEEAYRQKVDEILDEL